MRTILLADDNEHIREHCRNALEDEGYRVVAARDGFDALRQFVETRADAAVLDICMPRMNGLEALERLKDAAPNLPVILFTSYDEDCVHDRRASLATACIEKSDDLAELKLAIRRALDRKATNEFWEEHRLGLPPTRREATPPPSRLTGNAAR
jgi:two-component system, OmpR family, response regulator